MRALLTVSVAAIVFALPAVAAAEPEAHTDGMSPAARAIYEQRYLTVTDEFEVTDDTATRKVYGLYRGTHRQPLKEAEFFETRSSGACSPAGPPRCPNETGYASKQPPTRRPRAEGSSFAALSESGR